MTLQTYYMVLLDASYIAHSVVLHCTQEFHSIMQLVPLQHLLQLKLLGPVPADYEVHRGKFEAKKRNHSVT
jgi:hypothetical protein